LEVLVAFTTLAGAAFLAAGFGSLLRSFLGTGFLAAFLAAGFLQRQPSSRQLSWLPPLLGGNLLHGGFLGGLLGGRFL
jgi:hypothetical protein